MTRPVLLIDCKDGLPVESYRTSQQAGAAQILLTQFGSCPGARSLSASALHQTAADACQRLYGTRAYESLPLPKYNAFLRALRSEFRRA